MFVVAGSEPGKAKRYRSIEISTVFAVRTNGEEVVRGDRGSKAWRTADNRLPARRSEWKD